jgi:hypothetical protein
MLASDSHKFPAVALRASFQPSNPLQSVYSNVPTRRLCQVPPACSVQVIQPGSPGLIQARVAKERPANHLTVIAEFVFHRIELGKKAGSMLAKPFIQPL